jgi:hypothetical protein
VNHLSSRLEHFGLCQAFVTLEGEASKTDRRRLRAPKCVVSLEKVCEGQLHLRKERSKLVDRLGVGLVNNSSFLNRGIGIMG